MTEKTYEMQWDCQFCGTTKLLGKTHRFCPNCGGAQDPASRYYPKEEEKVAVEDHVFVGRDRTCPSCSTLNSAEATFCGNCGSAMEGVSEVKTLEERETLKAQTAEATAKPKRSGLPMPVIIALVVGVVLCGGVIWLFTRSEEISATVSAHEWERTIVVDEYQATAQEAWCDTMPSGAYNVRRSQEVRETRQIADGQDCSTVRRDNGDGTFSERQECTTRYRDEPVYDDYCRFTLDQWAEGRRVQTSGNALAPAPAWGNVQLNCANSSRLGCEREGNRTETYTVTFTNEGENYECNLPQTEWQGYAPNSQWSLDINPILNSANCDSLQQR